MTHDRRRIYAWLQANDPVIRELVLWWGSGEAYWAEAEQEHLGWR